MTKIQPLADRVVAQAVEASDKAESGFHLPQDAKEKPQMATVVEVGKDVSEIKKGDMIIYPKGSATKEVIIDSAEYMVLKEEDVLGVIK